MDAVRLQLWQSFIKSWMKCLLVTGGCTLHSSANQESLKTTTGHRAHPLPILGCVCVCVCVVCVCVYTKEEPLFIAEKKWVPLFFLLSFQDLLFLLIAVIKNSKEGFWELSEYLKRRGGSIFFFKPVWPSNRIWESGKGLRKLGRTPT